eukprot:TRINITY_DN3369_c0_g4_i1.p1 TRINITY_DN3369_c0_g4~~TRINITY_DN3369_c0_g4_i1.p1  ORF type:complete len:233 (+),score=29.47 TRINITY_DN3369_c0_g4_i1:79-699(+)
MADDSLDADMQERSWLQRVPSWLQEGRDVRTEPYSTLDSCRTRSSSIDEAKYRWPQDRASVGATSSVHQAHDLTGDGSSGEVQMCGSACSVRKLKPSRLGCAIVELASSSMREEVMSRAEQSSVVDGVPRMEIHGVSIKLRRHIDRQGTTLTQEQLTGIFISWPHCVEKQAPLPLRALVDAFDAKVAQIEAPEPYSLPAPRFISLS